MAHVQNNVQYNGAPNKGVQRTGGGTAAIRNSVTQSQLGGSATPAADAQALGTIGRSDMDQEVLLMRVKQAIHEVEPAAEIILYGSRSREDAGAESDWDFLVLVDGPVNDARVDAIRHRLYELEWESGEVLCSVVRSRKEWDSPRYQVMPFHLNVEREGILL